MSRPGPRRGYAETTRDGAPVVNGRVPQQRIDNRNAAGVAPSAGAKSNAESIAAAAAKLQITDEDVIIAVMGLTGVGKSTFIKHLSDSEILIGHDLNSCTVNVAVHPFFLNDGRRAYLVDTPGFDDGTRPEAEILEEVSNFFAATYSMKITLAGVIYLHRISDIRMSGAMLKNLKMLKKLCGKNCYSKIVLATTMWDRLTDGHRAVQNERQLGDTHEWWGDLAEEGATIMRQDDGAKSAMKIVEHIMSFAEPAIMENQIERVVKNLALEECESGKVIAEELIKQKEEHERLMAEKREEYERQIKEGNARAAEKLAKLEDKHREKTEEMNRSQAALARKFEESNSELQRQISAHNEEMEEVRKARIKADNDFAAATNELADFKAEQARKEKQWKDDRDSDKAAFQEQMEQERLRSVQRESEITERIQQAVERAQESRKTSKGVWAVLGGVATSLAGAATLNPVLIGAGVAMAAGGGSRAAYKASKS